MEISFVDSSSKENRMNHRGVFTILLDYSQNKENVIRSNDIRIAKLAASIY